MLISSFLLLNREGKGCLLSLSLWEGWGGHETIVKTDWDRADPEEGRSIYKAIHPLELSRNNPFIVVALFSSFSPHFFRFSIFWQYCFVFQRRVGLVVHRFSQANCLDENDCWKAFRLCSLLFHARESFPSFPRSATLMRLWVQRSSDPVFDSDSPSGELLIQLALSHCNQWKNRSHATIFSHLLLCLHNLTPANERAHIFLFQQSSWKHVRFALDIM